MPTEDGSIPKRENSGKLLIAAVLAVGVVAAAASWWFRYSATHRAAEFWGPVAVGLIRDAPRVTLRTDATDDDPLEISGAPGLTHLRNALLEDGSYDWTADGAADTNWSNSLVFEETEGADPRIVVLFSPDFRWAANGSAADPAGHAVATTSDFSGGLKTFFAEQKPPAAPE